VSDQSPASSPLATRLISIAVASALLMEFIDSTALSTALPTLSRAFAVDPIHLKLALTSYILALAVFTPASGWAAERFGARRVFLSAMTVFLLGSALCGQSRSLEALVASRIVQGIGGAMMTPVARLIVVSATPKDKLLTAMGWFTMPALVGPLIGPPTDEAAFARFGAEGVLAMVCDSTNALVEGHSGSEAEVRRNMTALIKGIKLGRIAPADPDQGKRNARYVPYWAA